MDPEKPILGIWGYSSDAPGVQHHDAGAAVVQDGRIVAAVNEERLSRKKNDGDWPSRSIAEVLRLAALRPDDIGLVSMGGRTPLGRANAVFREALRAMRAHRVNLANRLQYALLTAKKIRRRGPEGIAAPVVFVPHHEAHAASAYWTGPFREATVLTLDGIGDSAECGGIFRGTAGRVTPVRWFSGYDSLGIFYAYFTRAFGFKPARHEGKIMGLAARGDARRLLPLLEGLLRYDGKRGGPHSPFVARLFRERTDDAWTPATLETFASAYAGFFEKNSREDICAALQALTERVAAQIAARALRETGIKNLVAAGGVFANVRVNQILREKVTREHFVHPHMGDGGLAAGAALAAWAEAARGAGRIPKPALLPDAFLGTDLGSAEAEALLDREGLGRERPADLAERITQALLNRRLVGYAAGRMEYGPRALGHRTILAMADSEDVTEKLNRRLQRNDFMPFAPIVAEAYAERLLVGWRPTDYASRFMTMTYDVTGEGRRSVPAVVHLDGTARPQVLSPETEPILHEALLRVARRTGAIACINTSFNIHEEPILRTAEEALKSARQGAVDDLVLGPYFVENAGASPA